MARKTTLSVVCACATLVGSAVWSLAQPGTTSRVSVDSKGQQADNTSYPSGISPDGRVITFLSEASNLTPNGAPAPLQLYTHDRTTGRTDPFAAGGIADSWGRMSVSRDGSRIAIQRSFPTVDGLAQEVATLARDTQKLTLLTTHARAFKTGGTWCDGVVLSDNGTFAFWSFGYYIKEHYLGVASWNDLVMQPVGGTPVVILPGDPVNNHGAQNPSASSDGSVVAYARSLPNGTVPESFTSDIYVLESQELTRITVGVGGEASNGNSERPVVSADGRFIVYQSQASNLVKGDTNKAWDVFVFDRDTRQTIRVSVGSEGEQADGDSVSPSLSADGRVIAFVSYATNLTGGIVEGRGQVYVHEQSTRRTICVSVTPEGAPGNQDSFEAFVSADGLWAVFGSYASDLVADDTNEAGDVFVRELDGQCKGAPRGSCDESLRADSDGDGLLDVWEEECCGVDGDGDGVPDLNLYALGARVGRRDLFVEVDAMTGFGPPPYSGPVTLPPGVEPTGTVLDLVAEAFGKAPGGGIALHITLDELDVPVIEDWRPGYRMNAVRNEWFGLSKERLDANWLAIERSREKTFRYIVFCNELYTDDFGLAPGPPPLVFGRAKPGAVIATGRIRAFWELEASRRNEPFDLDRFKKNIASTFMHELGHCLGLEHGGADNISYKPNYPSVMNYSVKIPFNGIAPYWLLDYSRHALSPLNEDFLFEDSGLRDPDNTYTKANFFMPYSPRPCGATSCLNPPNCIRGVRIGQRDVDWNGNNTPDSITRADINAIRSSGEGCELLEGHDDWAGLRYYVPDIISYPSISRDDDFGLEDLEPEEFGLEEALALNDAIPLLGCPLEREEDPVSQAVASGRRAEFFAAGYGSGVHTFQWRRNGEPLENGGAISGADEETLVIDPVSEEDEGDYDCVITNHCSTITSAAAALVVTCAADFTGDGLINSADLASLLGAWGSDPGQADLNGDGLVNAADLAALLGAWGPCP